MKPRRKRDAVAAAHDAEEAEEKTPNPYYLPEGIAQTAIFRDLCGGV